MTSAYHQLDTSQLPAQLLSSAFFKHQTSTFHPGGHSYFKLDPRKAHVLEDWGLLKVQEVAQVPRVARVTWEHARLDLSEGD